MSQLNSTICRDVHLPAHLAPETKRDGLAFGVALAGFALTPALVLWPLLANLV